MGEVNEVKLGPKELIGKWKLEGPTPIIGLISVSCMCMLTSESPGIWESVLWNRQSLFANLIQARSEVPRLVLSLRFSTTRLSAYHVPCTPATMNALQFLSPLATIRRHLRRFVTLSEAAPLSVTFSWYMTTCWRISCS